MAFRQGILGGITILIFTTGCTSNAERAFMMGCVAHESMKEQCECAYEELVDHYSEEQLEKMNEGYVPPDFLNQMESAAMSCKA
ncbi:hypothetical protein [Agitococcus lubricus]|uniref:Lipoprotein n=1 Tax=Agitococcus lubricus TaxID=1077255 RepID=A0A2T5ITJ8_9GAMM|nr:hypothetical protein [Agitococcus lubricus]PTQ87179.1 hypothetical protein C8N29_12114 [Agitococcus lubricus]